jgi:hypothetical protein
MSVPDLAVMIRRCLPWSERHGPGLPDRRERAMFPGSEATRARISCMHASRRPLLRTIGWSRP